MGGPKALMRVGGKPWWMRQLEALEAAEVAPVWVVSPDLRAAIEREALGFKQPLVQADPEAPMFESIRAGLRFLEPLSPRAVYILPIDVPAPGPEVWRVLDAPSPACAPSFEGAHGHPVCLDWAFARGRVLDAAPGARLDDLIAPVIRYIEVGEPRVALNLNTPESVRAYEREFLEPA